MEHLKKVVDIADYKSFFFTTARHGLPCDKSESDAIHVAFLDGTFGFIPKVWIKNWDEL